MRNVYIVRHTESEHHVKKLGGGWHDTFLTEKGRQQAKNIAENLFNEVKVSGIPIYSSDLKRCAETAAIISEIFNSQVTLDKNLREMNFGDGNGKPVAWFDKHITPPPADGNRLEHRNFKNAESRREAGVRATDFIYHLMEEPFKDAIVVTHGGFSTFLILAWLKVPVENMDYAFFGTRSGGVDYLYEDDFWHSRYLGYFNKLDFLNGT
jgi:probable phosphoglycerate mutase